jgi:endonuclease III
MQPNIPAVVRILKKNSPGFATTSLAEIAERSDDPYKVLISCILSLRTRDETTARVSQRLYEIADTPRKISSLPLKRLETAIKSVNYYKTKALRIKEMSRVINKKYRGHVPNDMESLLELKGVGRKTANIVLVYGFGKHGIPVDTHVHRVSNRLGWVSTKTPEKTETALRAMLPKRYWLDINDLFVQFGQNVCRPRNPKCWSCPITAHCRYYRTVYMKTDKKVRDRK